jgi:recombinational DNA repair protein RecR
MVRVRPRSLRKKSYKARSEEDRCHVCGNLRTEGHCINPYCKENKRNQQGEE